jgi:N-acetylated-alpha-linked acidic dipeptidase
MNRLLAALLGASLILTAPGTSRAALTTNEQYVIGVMTSSRALEDSRRLNQESHYASTPGDYHIARWMEDVLKAAGFNASLEPFAHDVPFSRKLSLELYRGKNNWERFDLDETPIASDPDGTRSDAGPPFNAWSGSGTTIANIVDAGHGMPDDYTALASKHIDPRTRILLVRYGREFRGLLAKRAQDHGARGVLFFSDPHDRDGSRRGPAYPEGPYRPLGAVARGSLGEGQITIPTLPITASNAQRIINDMRDGITQTPYRLSVSMLVERGAQLWNTVGVLPGKDPTHEVVLGAHRDAWVYGVTDNGSGVSILLDVARALGALYKNGWRPQYSIVIVGFDGEEIGEVGSNAYVRAHWGSLESGCLAYINEDEATTGQIFGATAAAALENLVAPVTHSVPDPASDGNVPLYYRWQHQTGGAAVRGPGGGSDFEAFLYDAGIPIMDYGFGGIFGVYHSGFDDLRYATTQADPNFVNHRGVAQLVALTAMRLAGGSVGYSFTPYVARMRTALASIAAAEDHGGDLTPVRSAIDRYATAAAAIDRHGGDGNAEIAIVHRLDRLFYGRNGYEAIAFPDVATALATGNGAAISAAAGRTAHALDEISSALANATRR